MREYDHYLNAALGHLLHSALLMEQVYPGIEFPEFETARQASLEALRMASILKAINEGLEDAGGIPVGEVAASILDAVSIIKEVLD